MEAYFYNDPRVREWVDQITEKIFTVCLLTGVDSDAEFQSGCQIVMKIVSSLKEIPTIPSEFLADGVKQLLEQQLPDTRVMQSFPAFKATMDRMVHESLLMVLNQNKEAVTSLASSKEDAKEPTEGLTEEFTEEPTEEITKELDEEVDIEVHDNDQEMHVAESNEEFLTESAISALATNCITRSDIQVGADVVANVAQQIKAEVEIEKDTNVLGTKPVPDEVKQEPLKRVLSNIFPNSPVNWNRNLMGQIFLAQVEDILIYLHDPEHPFSLNNFYKEGWKVLVCSTEDLTFPRRLGRGIRQIQRTGKKSFTV